MDPITTSPTPTMEPKKDKTLIYAVIGVVIVLLVSLAAFWYITSKPTSQPTSTIDNSIKTNSDLNSVENSLDSADVDGLGSELDQNDTDASQF